MSLEGCDVALFDNGHVTFYNTEADKYVPFETETDSVINGVFVEGDSFYYTVKIGKELFLRRIDLNGSQPHPKQVADWGLGIDDCVSETYGKASPLMWMSAFKRVGINYDFSWDFYNFSEIKFYDYIHGKILDGWNEKEDFESDLFDEEFVQYEEDLDHFASIEDNYYYGLDDNLTCLTDKIDFKDYCYDPGYCSEPEFVFYSIDPTRKFVAFVALIEWGDLGHGPLCMASLDGEIQMAFKNTDAADLSWGWLSNGSLLYIGAEPRSTDDLEYDPDWNATKPCIRIAHPDGTDEVFAHSTDFVVKK